MSIEALKKARRFLMNSRECDARKDALEAVEKAIAEAEKQEPVAKVVLTETLELPCLQWLDLNRQFDFKGGKYLYTHPQPKRDSL
jgi:hypothetical protein